MVEEVQSRLMAATERVVAALLAKQSSSPRTYLVDEGRRACPDAADAPVEACQHALLGQSLQHPPTGSGCGKVRGVIEEVEGLQLSGGQVAVLGH